MASVFISHSWSRASDEYERVLGFVEKCVDELRDRGVPAWRRIPGIFTFIPGVLQLAIKDRIKGSDIFIFIAHPASSEWVDLEVRYAHKLGKEIIAIEPPGYSNVSGIVRELSLELVQPNGNSIKAAVNRSRDRLKRRRNG